MSNTDLFIEAYNYSKKNYKKRVHQEHILSSVISSVNQKTFDPSIYNELYKYIPPNSPVSNAHSGAFIGIDISINQYPDFNDILQNTTNIFVELANNNVEPTHHLTISSFLLAKSRNCTGDAMKKFIELYNFLSENFKWQYSQDQNEYMAVLSLCDKDIDTIKANINNSYEFFVGNKSTKPLAMDKALLFAGATNHGEYLQKTLDLLEILKSNKFKLGIKDNESIAVALMSMIDEDINTLANKIVKSNDELKTVKDFGKWKSSDRERIMCVGELMDTNGNEYATQMQEAMMYSFLSTTFFLSKIKPRMFY